MQWETPEHRFKEKTNDWYASVILIAGALVAIEFLVNNFLLITLTMVGTAAVRTAGFAERFRAALRAAELSTIQA